MSHHAIASGLEIAGLIVVLIGSVTAAYAVILKPDDAIKIGGRAGVAPYGVVIPTRDEFLQQPAVRNLIRQSKMATWGLSLIAVGTFIQIIGVSVDAV
jgi:hypothetical protein